MAAPSYLQPIPSIHPYKDAGTASLILGIIIAVGGGYATTVCTVTYTFTGNCAQYGYAGVGYILVIVGIIMAVFGVVLMLLPRPSSTPPVVYVQQSPQPYPGTIPPTPASRFCTFCGAPNSPSAVFCERCGKALPHPQ